MLNELRSRDLDVVVGSRYVAGGGTGDWVYAVCGMGAPANIGIAAYAFSKNLEWALSAAAGIIVGTLWNYLATARFTWGSRK